MKYLVILVFLLGCSKSEHRAARVKYNEGVAALAKGDLDGATKALLEARSAAGVDPELRFRAAYDLGLAYAEQAAKIRRDPKGDLAKALEYAQQAASWLADANRLRPDDAATKKNLGIVRARLQAISDELRKGEGKLEARIDAAINDQREVLGGVREAWLAIKKAGGTDPLAQQGALTRLADVERGVVAEVGAITDIAADEIDVIGKKAEDKRTDEEKIRVVQLKNIELYLQEARGRIAEARRKLQELAAEEALGRAEAALVAIKRAREQLLDPITVLKTVAQDELEIVRDTVSAGGGEKLSLDPTAPKDAATPAWLAPQVLAERQSGLRDRLEEVRARLAAGAEAPPDPKADPQQQKLLERVKTALPAVVTASAEMEQAKAALGAKQLTKALEHEQRVLVALAKAIEEFSDLKQTIELAYDDQNRIVALLSPEGAKLPAADRAQETKDALARNLARATRLQGLIADELAQISQQPPPPGGEAEKDPKKLEAAQQQLEQAKQQMARAETLRGEALTALGKLEKALATAGTDPVPSAAEAKTKLEELRKLFFSVIEHLQQLIRDQGETRDQTSAASGLDEFARADKLPGIVTREEQHGQMAKAITDALAAQADEMAKNPQAQQQGGPDAKAFTAAADEVRLAQGAITDAQTTIVKARDAKQSSESLAPAVKSQGTALEHLENALKHLQPPSQQNQDDQQQQDKEQQAQQQEQQQQQQPAGAGQAARDQDAAQQKKRREQENASDSSVEKDW